MTLGSVTARNLALDSRFGSSKGSTWPANIEFALYDGDPMTDGVEITGGGYAVVVKANTDATWNPAADGQKTNAVEIQFPTSTGAWIGTARYMAIRRSTDQVLLEVGLIADDFLVELAGVVVSFPEDTIVIVASAGD